MEYLMDIEINHYHGHLHKVIGIPATSWVPESFQVAVDWDESEPDVPYGLFAVHIPVKDYSKEEFVEVVEQAILKRIPETIALKKRLAKEDEDNSARRAELNKCAEKLNRYLKNP